MNSTLNTKEYIQSEINKSLQFPLLSMFTRLIRNRFTFFGLLIIGFTILIATFGPSIVAHDPEKIDPQNRLSSPSTSNILGTDHFGRDILSRIVYGARVSLTVAFASIAFGATVGLIIGLVSGYWSGIYDRIFMGFMDIMFAFPVILLALTIVTILGPGMSSVMLAIGIINVPTFARITRSAVITVRESDYVMSAVAVGAKNYRIIIYHILPNSMAPIIVQSSLALSIAVLVEASLSFLGLGVQPPLPSWGSMLHTGYQYIETAPWLSVVPGVAIALLVLGFNLLGDGLREVLDPHLKD
jgi:peptide/nickel transport system permease protein